MNLADELVDNATYERIRPRVRPRLLAAKRELRVCFGPLCLHFETGDTVLYYLQEVLRAEGITSRGAVRRKLDEVRALVPQVGEITATLMIQRADAGIAEAFSEALDFAPQAPLTLQVGGERRAFRPVDAGADGEPVRYLRLDAAGLHLGRLPTAVRLEFGPWRRRVELDEKLCSRLRTLQTPVASHERSPVTGLPEGEGPPPNPCVSNSATSPRRRRTSAASSFAASSGSPL